MSIQKEVNSLPRFNLTSPDGTWDPSSTEFEASDPDPIDSNLSQYPDDKPSRELCSIQSDPVIDDEMLSSINPAFDSRAFISAL